MKKGQDIHFNWIFIVIAGAVILLFFSFFIVRYRDLQDHRLNAEIARGVDNIINSLRSTEQYKNISFDNEFKIDFSCESFTINNDYVQDSNIILFSPSSIQSRKLYVWAKELKLPYQVSNVIFLTSNKDYYYLIKDPGNFANQIKDSLPSIFTNIQLIDYNEISSLDLKNKNPKFIFFSNPSSNQVNELKSKGSVVYIEPKEYGIIKFYNEDKEAYFITKPLVYGAIFSGNYENYKCNFDRFIKKLGNINSIYIKKIDYLESCCGSNCNYNNIKTSLSSYKNLINSKDYTKFLAISETLNQENNNLYNMDCRSVF